MPEALAREVLELFAARGCSVPGIALLQPADPFLDTAGEDLRRRIFITADRHGKSLCLRPEFTIPVAMHHLAVKTAKARYAYAGSVFRQRVDEPVEFIQAGIEDVGNEDRTAADLAAISDCADAVSLAGAGRVDLIMGDQALFEAALEATGLPPAWRARLGRNFGDTALLGADLERLEKGGANGSSDLPEPAAVMVSSGDRAGVIAWIEAAMDEAGLAQSGSRSASEIADRVFARAELAAFRLPAGKLSALKAFLAIDAAGSSALEALAGLHAAHGLDLGAALDRFAERQDALDKAGLSPRYVASFGRRLDYYTGLVFELRRAGQPKPLAGGGRYDRLMTLLGSTEPLPAVGFSIWLDRIKAANENGEGDQ